MTGTDFTQLLQNPQNFSTEQTEDVKSLIAAFPYFQPARALYLKALKNKESFKYNQELKTTAAYTTDRSVLFDYITSEEFLQNEVSNQIKQNSENLKHIDIHGAEDISVQKSVVIDDALRDHIKFTEPLLDPHLFEEKPELPKNSILEVDEPLEKTPEEQLELGKPLEFDKTQVYSFTEWLKITSFKPIIREEYLEKNDASTTEGTTSKTDLIDKFIETNPKMPAIIKENSTQDLASSHILKPESLMTETLARIYLEQNNYEKAIQAYKILSLKYPEKSGFFADQIQAIKQIQNK